MRAPDFVIKGAGDEVYLRRWWVIPRNRLFNVYLHQFLHDDDDRALHDHPWLFNLSIMLRGAYIEHTFDGPKARRRGGFYFRWGRSPHRVVLPRGPVWTLFITGPVVRDWGFYCPQGWRHWRDFTRRDDPGAIGKGCE
jgi:hypothetical protein